MTSPPLITSDPERMGGIPCFTGTRVPVTTLFDYLMASDGMDAFLQDFPSVTREHADSVLRAAATQVSSEASNVTRYEHSVHAR